MKLFFHVADASGHGARGAKFWEEHGSAFAKSWEELVQRPACGESLRQFASALNRDLHGRSDRWLDRTVSYACLLFGFITTNGDVCFANLGYGNHALVSTAHGVWWKDPAELYGLKLGWLSPDIWRLLPGAFASHEVAAVQRLVLLTDGFLGDDHADPCATLESVHELAGKCAVLPFDKVLPEILALPHEDDDASAIVVDVHPTPA